MTVHIGFTGTRTGMTAKQSLAVEALLAECRFYAHHGDCVGADAQFDVLSHRNEWCHCVYIHPPTDNRLRAFCEPGLLGEVLPAKPYLERDRAIAEACDWMIATPKSAMPEPNSGTWYTIRYAQSIGKPVAICLPDGSWIE